MATEKQIKANRENALKGGRHFATATLEAQEIRKQLTAKVAEHLDEMIAPQIAKAMDGDTQAFQALVNHILPKLSENKNENKNEQVYRLEDETLQKKAMALVELQKHGTTKGTTGSPRTET